MYSGKIAVPPGGGGIQFLLVFTAMLMLCSLLWFKEINELIRLFVNLLKVGCSHRKALFVRGCDFIRTLTLEVQSKKVNP
jgi:hypothetical protein